MSSWTRRASSLPLPASHTRAVLSSDAVTNAASKMFDGNVCAASGSALSPIGSPGAAHNYLILLAVPTGGPEVSKSNDLRKSGKSKRSRAFHGVPQANFPPWQRDADWGHNLVCQAPAPPLLRGREIARPEALRELRTILLRELAEVRRRRAPPYRGDGPSGRGGEGPSSSSPGASP